MKQTQQPSCSSHLNKGTENLRQQNTKAQEENRNYKMIPAPCPPHPNPNINQPPVTYFIPPIICNNNKMDMAFMVQMTQSNKCGSVRNYEIINLHL